MAQKQSFFDSKKHKKTQKKKKKKNQYTFNHMGCAPRCHKDLKHFSLIYHNLIFER
jgi:hypothetical protein